MDDKPTELTQEDIDKYISSLTNSLIEKFECIKCSKEYFNSYGHHISECDQCYFEAFNKEVVIKVCKSYLEE